MNRVHLNFFFFLLQTQDSASSSEQLSAPAHTPDPLPPGAVRCRALYDCEADNDDELSFREGEILLMLTKDEDEWWHGYVEAEPDRRGMFPATFVDVLPD